MYAVIRLWFYVWFPTTCLSTEYHFHGCVQLICRYNLRVWMSASTCLLGLRVIYICKGCFQFNQICWFISIDSVYSEWYYLWYISMYSVYIMRNIQIQTNWIMLVVYLCTSGLWKRLLFPVLEQFHATYIQLSKHHMRMRNMSFVY